jgi:hypothetical protein
MGTDAVAIRAAHNAKLLETPTTTAGLATTRWMTVETARAMV